MISLGNFRDLSELAYAKAEHRGFGGSLPPPKWKSEHPLIEVGVSELINSGGVSESINSGGVCDGN